MQLMAYMCHACGETRQGDPHITVTIDIGTQQVITRICAFCGIDALKE